MRWLVTALVLTLVACAPRVPELTLSPTAFNALEGWAEDDHEAALQVFLVSCEALEKKPQGIHGPGKLQMDISAWQAVCTAARSTPPEDARVFFEMQFTPYYAGADGKEEGLFTGYYEPVLRGCLQQSTRCQVPVYALPDDVVAGEKFFSHEEISRGALANRGLEVAWAEDPVDLFFAQVQGSTRLLLEDGTSQRLSFAGKNNREYIAIGKLLAESGEMEKDDINLFTLKDWLRKHPGRGQELMWQNPSYVFFTREPHDGKGPRGASGSALTPMRSLAIDKNYIPYGLPVFLQTTLPEGETFNRLMIAQDTGGAIKGPVRGDVFFGAGAEAEKLAGLMKQQGSYVLLLPNALASKW